VRVSKKSTISKERQKFNRNSKKENVKFSVLTNQYIGLAFLDLIVTSQNSE
jgi:hypothetical protein